uniref:Thioredoxin domain-containing protein n=1 Tax=Octactis speculum TaxID=3111310 RepID=A0A6U3T919_9STRA|mmetsp:Transcript_35485/g.47907  ORF Transcript_35485/g.47907 Transcript_35485/m.47907 type:complete len:152 (+) Transcript_35485:42-497(+)
MKILRIIVWLCVSVTGCHAFTGLRSPNLLQKNARVVGRNIPQMAVDSVGSESEFDGQIKDAGEKLVVIDFSTTWCGPCKVMEPKFYAMSDEHTDAVFLKVIGDSSPDASKLMKREGVRSVPSFHFWKNGEKMDIINGANVDALQSAIGKYI